MCALGWCTDSGPRFPRSSQHSPPLPRRPRTRPFGPTATQQATEDEESRDEKIKRASFDIKTAHATGSPPTRRVVSPAAWAQVPPSPHAQQPAHSTATGAPQQRQQEQQQQSQQQHGASQQPQQLTLTPQEVLQELLGDMYIDQSRLTMGEHHCSSSSSTTTSSKWCYLLTRHTQQLRQDGWLTVICF